MSFANVSNTPNCQRDDQFDKFNARVWYFLSEDLMPKLDGSLHELTITYNNNFSYNKMPPPIPLNDRKREDIKVGYWPGMQLKPIQPEDNCDDNESATTSSKELISSDDESGEVIDVPITITEQEEIEYKQQACLQIVQTRIKSLLNKLKMFKDEVIKICYDNGLFGLEFHLKNVVTIARKGLASSPLKL